jgi:uncharacterized membrane protein YeaQ/YmgE (transglycosylase-associated protein family)
MLCPRHVLPIFPCLTFELSLYYFDFFPHNLAHNTHNSGGMMFDLIWFLLVGLAAGFLAGKIFAGKGLGLLGNLIVGVIGAFLGRFIFMLVGISAHSLLGSLISATLGALLLLWLLTKIKK